MLIIHFGRATNKYKDVEPYEARVIWGPLLDELNALKCNGLCVTWNGSPHTVVVIVMAVCGDNLSQHKLAGFSAGFSKGRVCRFCMVTSANLSHVTHEEECRIRTSHVHDIHLAAVKVNPTMNCSVYGVTGPSPMGMLGYFDVTSQVAPDLMHDLFEGVLPFVLRHVLRGLISEGTLTFSDLKRSESFSYGYNDRKNTPETFTEAFIMKDANLKGTASQKWCIFRLFPLIFGASVPENNAHWGILLQLQDIVGIVLAEELPEDWIAFLEVLVQYFLKAFIELYPQVRLIPKMHYIVHYARLTRKLGPLRHYWCLRYEAKHQYFKNMASRVKNFRNICKTLASRHQLLQSFEMFSLSNCQNITTSCAKTVDVLKLPPVAQSLCCREGLLEAKGVALGTCSYRVQDILVEGKDESPTFVQLINMYISGNEVWLLVESFILTAFRNICLATR